MYISATEKAIAENAGLAVKDLEDFAAVSDLHEIAVDGVTAAARTIHAIEDDLRAKIKAARRDLDTAEAALDAGYAINPCGVLQSTATMIDMLAARRADAYTRLMAACRTVAALPAPAMVARQWGARYNTREHGRPAVAISEARDRDHAANIAGRFSGQILTRTVITGTWRPDGD
jgi:hypothetical protein